MKAKIRLYENDGSTDSGFPVKLIISHDKKTRRRIISHTQIYDWDKNVNLPRASHPDYDALYDKISQINKKAQTSDFLETTDLDLAFNKLLSVKTVSTDFYQFGDQRVKTMEDLGRFGNADIYREALVELKKFQPNLSFKEISFEILRGFRDYKKAQGTTKNISIRKYLNALRAIYNSAPATLTEGKNPFKGLYNALPYQKRRARNRYLLKEQIRWMEEFDFVHKSYQRAIDLSLLQFYMCGADLTDVFYLKKEDISGGRIFLKRNKLGEKGYEFDFLLTDKAKAIIDKYKGGNDEYVFPWKKGHTSYKTFRSNHNRNLKILQERYKIELHPKDDSLTTKVMRHTFATLGKFEHLEEDLLRELMGHERYGIDTVYKDKYPVEERNAAQLLIVD